MPIESVLKKKKKKEKRKGPQDKDIKGPFPVLAGSPATWTLNSNTHSQ
jgi:hypothetical protein